MVKVSKFKISQNFEPDFFLILYCLQKSFGQRDLCGISYSVLFKLNGENKRMLYLAFHILYCVRCVQLWERTDAVEQ